jgi:hypothetical protein
LLSSAKSGIDICPSIISFSVFGGFQPSCCVNIDTLLMCTSKI